MSDKKTTVKATRVKKVNEKARKTSINPTRMMIEKLYNNSAPLLFFESILFILAAVIIFFKPVQILTIITLMFGIGLGLFGLYQACLGLMGGRREMAGKTMNVILGIVNVILGVVFIMQPAGSMYAIIYIFAALFLFKSVKSLILSISMWRAKFGHYIIDMLLSIGMIVLAVLLFFFPGIGAITLMYYIAITLLLYAMADIFMYVELVKLKKMTN